MTPPDTATPPPHAAFRPRIGAVAIGRNEGDRLVRCLDSLERAGLVTVYVDSGSTDGSREHARARGVEVVELDMTRPFTAARARNAGLERLLDIAPDAAFVQFVDGDCELDPDWIRRGVAALDARPDAVVACGRRAERHPRASVYNLLCDIEWDTPIGDAEACGGDALMRVAALRAVGGFRDDLIAGEEPELCHRLRRAGGAVLRVDAPMTRHDAAMTRFRQWWRRSVRSGHAAAELWALHGRRGVRGLTRIAERALFWALLVPIGLFVAAAVAAALVGAVAFALAGALLIGAFVLLAWRVCRHRVDAGTPGADAARYGVFCAIGKFPEALGVARYALGRLSGRRSTLIEYKGAAGSPAGSSPR